MSKTTTRTADTPDDDSIVGVPDHPMAAVAGALVAGAATGAVVGTAAGPLGAAIGAAAGAIAGALGGDAIASSADQVRDADHWRTNHTRRPYFREGDTFEDFAPAYEFGAASRRQHVGRTFDEVEPELAIGWTGVQGTSTLDWDRARHAARDAWGDDD